jgi:hypothetical protein
MRAVLLLLGCLGAAFSGVGVTNTTQVRMYCLSVRVEPGTAEQLGLPYTLTFSSAEFASPNHEYFPVFEAGLTHATRFSLEGPEFPEPLHGELVINAPEHLDENTNSVPDFYEVAVELPGPSGEGLWNSPVGGGEARFVWQRAAGLHRGTVRIQLTSDEFGTLPEFTHVFEIIEYAGTFAYERSEENANGLVTLARAGLETSTLGGPLVITREPTNRLNQFTINDSPLTNHLGATLVLALGDVERLPEMPLQYFGALAFTDGDPSTIETDYELFFIEFTDPNDTDGDGIPDLTDDAGPAPQRPQIAIARRTHGLELTLQGEPGVTFVLEYASRLTPDAELWLEDRQITLATTNEVVELDVPLAESRFWRLRWP